MNTTDNQIKVLQAFKEGKAVEVLCKDGTWKEIKEEVADYYPFNFATQTYRIKPKTRPYKNAEEFVAASLVHGPFLCKQYKKDVLLQPMAASQDGVDFFCNSIKYDYKLLIDTFLWQDGTPCGVEEE